MTKLDVIKWMQWWPCNALKAILKNEWKKERTSNEILLKNQQKNWKYEIYNKQNKK
jgi:hypothetical protein